MRELRLAVAAVWLGLTMVLFFRSVEPAVLAGIPLYIAAVVGSVAIHEAGHAVGAMLAGWRVIVFAVSRLAYHLPNRDVAILRRSDLHERSGWVLAVPSSASHNANWRHAIYVAGGPIANLLQAIAAYLWAANAQPGATILGAQADPLMMGITFLGLGLFIGNLVPRRVVEKANDGRLLLSLFRGGRHGAKFQPAAWAGALLKYKVRLRDIPQWMLDQDGKHPDADSPSARSYAAIEIGQTLDRSPVDTVSARAQIDKFWETYEPDDWLRACDAYLAATHERDLDRANRMIEQFNDPCAIPQMEAAARAAACKLAGHSELSSQWLEKMDEIVAAGSPFRDLTYREIRARIEAIQPLELEAPAALHGSAQSA